MTFREEVIRDALAQGIPRDVAEIIADEVTKSGDKTKARARIADVRQQFKLVQLCACPTLLKPFVEARLTFQEVQAALGPHVCKGTLKTGGIEKLRAQAANGSLKLPAPSLRDIAANVYGGQGQAK